MLICIMLRVLWWERDVNGGDPLTSYRGLHKGSREELPGRGVRGRIKDGREGGGGGGGVENERGRM